MAVIFLTSNNQAEAQTVQCPQVCTLIFKPICAHEPGKTGTEKDFSNECQLRAHNCRAENKDSKSIFFSLHGKVDSRENNDKISNELNELFYSYFQKNFEFYVDFAKLTFSINFRLSFSIFLQIN